MSVATEFAPEVFIPMKARPNRERHLRLVTDEPSALPSVLPPAVGPRAEVHAGREAVPVRLTRRGVAVIAAVVAVLATALVVLAWASAPAGKQASEPVPAQITIMPGDTLWSIAMRIAPGDPQREVADLERINHLSDAAIVPGQALRTH